MAARTRQDDFHVQKMPLSHPGSTVFYCWEFTHFDRLKDAATACDWKLFNLRQQLAADTFQSLTTYL